MKIDQKYFVPFVIIMAVVSAFIIAYFTISSQQADRQYFKTHITKQDSLKFSRMPVFNGNDSLSVKSFQGKFVVLDFWSTWSNFSENNHKHLAQIVNEYPDRLLVIAAVVEDKRKKVDDYIQRHRFPFHYVDGTQVFNKFDMPGVPVQLVYKPNGNIASVFFGSEGPAQFDSLRALISHE